MPQKYSGSAEQVTLPLSPLPIAEEFPLFALEQSLEQERNRPVGSDGLSQVAQDFRVACCLREIALHPDSSDKYATELFGESSELLTAVRNDANTKTRMRMDAGMLLANQPFFEARRLGDEVSDDTIETVWADLGRLGREFVSKDPKIAGRVMTLGAKLLLLRDGHIAHTPTFRELGTVDPMDAGVLHPFHHTGYLLDGDRQKIPWRNREVRDQSIVVLRMWEVTQAAFEAVVSDGLAAYKGREGAARDHLIGWAIDEACGDTLDGFATDILGEASDAVLARIKAKFPSYK